MQLRLNFIPNWNVTIVISSSAANKIKKLSAEELNASKNRECEKNNVETPVIFRLRIEVLGGGCSGFQYKYYLDIKRNEEDKIFNFDGAEVIVDETSFSFIKDSILDYIDDLGAAYFEIRNPNAVAKCGCGNSFAI